MKVLFFDTETTGLPEWQQPSGSECQPHIVQLAGILADIETREVISTFDVIIKPDGWEITKEMTEIHGVTNEHALEVGVPEKTAFEMLIAMSGNHKRVCYNRTFDQRIVRIAAKRFASEDVQNKWAEKDDFDCAMMGAQKVMGGKRPNLAAALKHFTGEGLPDAHSAMPDTEACMKVYWGILDAEKAQD